jgi:phosphatidylserine/phosphatidylglycerophosphate/cardiolipin synthase-like enzyme
MSYHFHITGEADAISNWTRFPGNLPKPLIDAINTYEESKYVQSPYVFPDVDKLTVKTVADGVEAMAKDLAVAAVFEDAQMQIRDALARRVVAVAKEHTAGILDSLKPQFDEAVVAYRELLKQLPDDCSPTSLIHAGGDAVVAYKDAKDYEAVLNGFHTFVASLFPGVADLTIYVPVNRAAYEDSGRSSNREGIPSDFAYALPVLDTERFKMRLVTPEEAYELVARFNDEPSIYYGKGMTRMVPNPDGGGQIMVNGAGERV